MRIKQTLTAKEVLDKFNLDAVAELAFESMEDVKRWQVHEDYQYEAHVFDIASGSWGIKQYIPLAEFFGLEFDETKADFELQVEIAEYLENMMDKVESLLNFHIKEMTDKLTGTFYFGYHEGDQSFSLFYTEPVEELV